MGNARKSQTFTFISISHLLLLLIIIQLNLHYVNLSTALHTADAAATTATVTNTTTTNSDIFSLETNTGISEFSTWEAASTHRLLAENSNGKIDSYTALRKAAEAACEARKYSDCVGDATGKGARPCNNYNRCKHSPS